MPVQHSNLDINPDGSIPQLSDRDALLVLDPTYITEEELQYELSLRGITAALIQTPRGRTGTLSNLLREEKEQNRPAPNVPPTNFAQEVTAVRAKLENFTYDLRLETPLTEYDALVIGARLAFLDTRIKRLANAPDKDAYVLADVEVAFNTTVAKYCTRRREMNVSRLSVTAPNFIPGNTGTGPNQSVLFPNNANQNNMLFPNVMNRNQPSFPSQMVQNNLLGAQNYRDSLSSSVQWSTGNAQSSSSIIVSNINGTLPTVSSNAAATLSSQTSAQPTRPTQSAQNNVYENLLNTQYPMRNTYNNRESNDFFLPPNANIFGNGNNAQQRNFNDFMLPPNPNAFTNNRRDSFPTFPTQWNRPSETFSINNPNHGQRLKPIPIHQWQLYFSGEEKKVSNYDLNVHDFIFQINIMKLSQGISDFEMLGHVGMLLTNSARVWYLSNYGRFASWNEFINALQQRFKPNFSIIDAMNELTNRKQKRNESPSAFLNSMVMTLRTLPINFTEQQQVELIQKNLLPDIQLSVAPWQPRSIDHLEHLLSLMNITRVTEIPNPLIKRFAVRKNVNVVNQEKETESDSEVEITEEEICAIIKNRKQKQTEKAKNSKSNDTAKINPDIICFNCRQKGHLFKDCPQPRIRIFCFKCGKEEVKSYVCPDCKQSKPIVSKNVAACLSQEVETPKVPDN